MNPRQLQNLGATEERKDGGQGRPTGATPAMGIDFSRSDGSCGYCLDAPCLLPAGGQAADPWDDIADPWGLVLREGTH